MPPNVSEAHKYKCLFLCISHLEVNATKPLRRRRQHRRRLCATVRVRTHTCTHMRTLGTLKRSLCVFDTCDFPRTTDRRRRRRSNVTAQCPANTHTHTHTKSFSSAGQPSRFDSHTTHDAQACKSRYCTYTCDDVRPTDRTDVRTHSLCT